MQTAQKLTPEELAETANTGTRKPVEDVAPILPEDLQEPAPEETKQEAKQETPQEAPQDDKANILIVGQSGAGKSRSLKGLDPERTIILSTEMKKLPFRGANKFKMNSKVSSFEQFKALFKRAIASPKADVVVIDSFTSLTEFAYNEIVKPCDPKLTMAAWQSYKDELHSILVRSKTCAKYVVFIAVEGESTDNLGQRMLFANVQGQLKNNVEKEFTVVLWAKLVKPPLPDGTPTQYAFMTNKDEWNKAKSPEEMFPPLIPNDLANAISWMDRYYNDDEDYEYKGPVITTSNENEEGDLTE